MNKRDYKYTDKHSLSFNPKRNHLYLYMYLPK